MRATIAQLMFIENMEKNFGITPIDYGFYSDGSIGVAYKDEFGLASVTVYPNGTTVKP
jgi:hypothetical protein